MRNSNLDERQRQKQTEAGNRAFWVMVVTCLVISFWDLFGSGKVSFDSSEAHLILSIGLLVYTVSNIRQGIWDSQSPSGVRGSLLFSVCFAGITTIAYWAILIINKKPGSDLSVNKMAGISFILLFIVSFIIYFGISYLTDRWKRRNEKRYMSD